MTKVSAVQRRSFEVARVWGHWTTALLSVDTHIVTTLCVQEAQHNQHSGNWFGLVLALFGDI